MVDDCLLHLTGENDIPILRFSFDRTGFHLPYRRASFLAGGELDFDGPNLGEADTVIFCERKTRLWEGKGLIAPIALKSWIARRFSLFDASKERLVCFLHAPQDILKHLGVDVMIFWPDLFDLC